MLERRSWLKLLTAAALFAVAALVFAGTAAAQNYPRRPVTVIIPWGAGGGTDAVGRYIAAQLEQELGQPFNVVNRTGGSGVVGHSAIAYARPDGYTIGLATVELTMMYWAGLTEMTHEDVEPVGLVNADPAGFMVNADSDWESVQQVLDHAADNPGDLTGSGTGQGGIWHLALAGLLVDQDMDPSAIRWVPSRGAAPGLQDLVAGGVDVVTASLPEGQSLIEAGRVRPLAVMGDERLGAFPDVPTLKQAMGSDWTTAAWRTIAAPGGTPDEIIDTLEEALSNVVNSQGYKDFLAKRGFGWRWMGSEDTAEFYADAHETNGRVMQAAGIANR